MIERMKKITLLVFEKDRDFVIEDLREAGVLHVKNIKTPASHEITFVNDRLDRVGKILSILLPYTDKRDRQESKEASEGAMMQRCEVIEDAYDEKQKILSRKNELRNELAWYGDWGEFNPADIARIAEKDISIKLYKIKQDDLKELGEREYFVLKREKGYVCIAVLSREGSDQELPFEEATIPEKGPDEIRAAFKELDEKEKEADKILRNEASGYGAFKSCKNKLKKTAAFLEVKFGMSEEGKFSVLQGYCPVKRLVMVRKLSEKYGTGLLEEAPATDEEVPTLVTNPRWISIIDPVFSFMSTVPGYGEFDISFYFLIFFSIFFAMLVGDAAYGTIFLVLTFLINRKLKIKNKKPVFLMYLLSGATILWGAITGTWFGSQAISQLPFFKSLVIPGMYSFSEQSQNNIIFLCFVIAVIHLTIAHIVKGVRIINSLSAIAQAGWIIILWGMFFLAEYFIMGNALPAFTNILFISGITLVLFFTNIEKGFFKGIADTLVDLPLSIISSFSDIVSYLRLFAVGYATLIVAKSFNDMALGAGINSVIGGFLAALVLFFGHLLNIVLALMAVIVHGIRLNMLEFSTHLGMQWSGKRYDPFREK